jgi:hypothetical protein
MMAESKKQGNFIDSQKAIRHLRGTGRVMCGEEIFV